MKIYIVHTFDAEGSETGAFAHAKQSQANADAKALTKRDHRNDPDLHASVSMAVIGKLKKRDLCLALYNHEPEAFEEITEVATFTNGKKNKEA